MESPMSIAKMDSPLLLSYMSRRSWISMDNSSLSIVVLAMSMLHFFRLRLIWVIKVLVLLMVLNKRLISGSHIERIQQNWRSSMTLTFTKHGCLLRVYLMLSFKQKLKPGAVMSILVTKNINYMVIKVWNISNKCFAQTKSMIKITICQPGLWSETHFLFLPYLKIQIN